MQHTTNQLIWRYRERLATLQYTSRCCTRQLIHYDNSIMLLDPLYAKMKSYLWYNAKSLRSWNTGFLWKIIKLWIRNRAVHYSLIWKRNHKWTWIRHLQWYSKRIILQQKCKLVVKKLGQIILYLDDQAHEWACGKMHHESCEWNYRVKISLFAPIALSL